ncbi:E3 SUMO-protein ligase KIAA1586-like isoform X2 [Ruditapes philippinarum]|uniref:E3 SUMO-protein ligase KIAA1586-like isoform X2 n=1 Tax=Ruditapes philippinarum TaxID=129788 RepID=UPI00295BF17A|nr:E3 SUMO-protein ligase KIAA1586-like isoform X2 [Ruditapes philippinarum]
MLPVLFFMFGKVKEDHQNAVDAEKLRGHMETARVASVSKSETAGVSQLADLKVNKHTSYEHSDSTREFQESISAVIEENILERVKSSEKYSLMFDESTDISVHQNLIMYIRILETDHLGVVNPKTHFFCIDSLERANAESIYAKVICTLNEKGIKLSGLCGVSTDGASVMVGNKSGVVTRLKQAVPGILATHCIGHRLALSCCSGADSIPYLVKVQEILNSVYKYFHFSPKHMAMLESIQQHTKGNSLKFKEVFHTRWLSFEGSVEALVRNYSDLVSVFLEESSGKALSLYKPITSFKFLYVVNFLCDILKPLAALSKSYQKSDLDFSEVTPLLRSTVAKVESLGSKKDGTCLSKFLSQVPHEPQVGDDGLMTFQYQGHTIRDGEKQRQEANSICDKFVKGMVRSMNDRFSDNDDSVVLTALCNYFNPVVDKDSKVDDVDVIVEYLGNVGVECNVDDLDMFLGYAHALISEGNKSVKAPNDVANLALRKKDVYPVASEAAERLLLAPVSTVDCERGFSKQNLIKTCLRSRLSVKSLDRLMRITVEGPEIGQFPFDKAFKKWAAVKDRRILQ